MNTSATTAAAAQSGSLRFEGVLGGGEYDLLKLAMPHYDELQAEIGKSVKAYCSGMERKRATFKLLEIGPGSGITTKVLLDCHPRIKITAVDNGARMAEAFNTKLEEWGAKPRVEFVPQDILAYLETVPDSSFDIVASGFVIHNIERKSRYRLIRHIHRVLAPGGFFVNGDKIVPDDPNIYADAYVAQIQAFDVFATPAINAPEVRNEWIEHYRVDAQPHIVYREAAALEDMRDARFTDVRTTYRHLLEAVVCGHISGGGDLE